MGMYTKHEKKNILANKLYKGKHYKVQSVSHDFVFLIHVQQ